MSINPDGWSQTGVWKLLYGSGVQRDVRDRWLWIEMLYSQNGNGPGAVGFICYNGAFTVRVADGPGLMPELIAQEVTDVYDAKGNPRRTFRPSIHVAGERAPRQKWIENFDDTLVMPTEQKHANQLYNAAVRGQDVTFERKGKFSATLALPPVDRAFRDFGKGCGM